MPTPMDLSETRRRQISRAVRPLVAGAGEAISRKVSDARAHAERSITGGLIAARDGRPTLDRAERSKALEAALARLDELWADLAGPEGKSPEGLIRDAWEAAFRDAWGPARDGVDEADLAGEEPTARMVARSRQLVLEGYDARGLMRGPIENAKRTLAALVPAMATPTRTAKERSDALAAWRSKVARAIGSAVGLAIFTGAFRVDHMAQRLVLKPELLHPDPTMDTAR